MTSIEWLLNQDISVELGSGIKMKIPIPKEIVEQAKEMHKQEIIQAFDSGVEDDGYIDNAEQYYQETFEVVSNTNQLPQQENLYTEEDLIDAIGMARNEPDMTWKDIIQSLKQPKKD
jgi:hypothetical protein